MYIRSTTFRGLRLLGLLAAIPCVSKGSAETSRFNACSSAADCNYNGDCTKNESCRCFLGWTGSACDALDLIPSPQKLGYHATDESRVERTSSWGGSVLQAEDGTYHMYAAEITGACGMNVWLSNSRIIHASSPDIRTTPFTRVSEVFPDFSHEPIARRAPTGEYVLWFTAVLAPTPVPVNGGRKCSGCMNGTSPARCGTDAARNASTPLPTYMIYSDGPDGPWSTPALIPGTTEFADSNFAPWILQNGSLVALTRHSVVVASHWKDVTSYHIAAQWVDRGEDPYVYRDRNGIYHNIVHVGRINTHGLHYWSIDGFTWTPSIGKAYNATIAYSDAPAEVLGCRERPHIVLDSGGNLVGLTNGAAPVTCHEAGGDDYAFTSMQLVGGSD